MHFSLFQAFRIAVRSEKYWEQKKETALNILSERLELFDAIKLCPINPLESFDNIQQGTQVTGQTLFQQKEDNVSEKKLHTT